MVALLDAHKQLALDQVPALTSTIGLGLGLGLGLGQVPALSSTIGLGGPDFSPEQHDATLSLVLISSLHWGSDQGRAIGMVGVRVGVRVRARPRVRVRVKVAASKPARAGNRSWEWGQSVSRFRVWSLSVPSMISVGLSIGDQARDRVLYGWRRV